MADIRLEGVGHSYDGGRTWAVKPMTWTWRSSRAYALLGPSGCGKTTLLNIISGLITPTEGRIYIDDRDVTGVPTKGRDIAQVFQFPVLYEEMSVYDNLAFPLRNRKVPKPEVDRRVRQVSRLLGLDHVLNRRSRRLDAGRQQIVSLGRGLVRSQVAAVLLDEPLTVVDPALKWTLRSKLKEIHRDTGHTLIYVTHDQTEALTFADEVVVLNDGAIVQAGEPSELFLSPAHEFVGHFIGSPGMNVLPAEVAGDVVRVGQEAVGTVVEPLPPGPVRIGVRPEFVRITPVSVSPGVPARVTGIDRMGAYDLVHTLVGEHPVVAKAEAGCAHRPEAVAFLHFPADRTFLFRDEVRCGSLAPLNGRGQV
ncbi:ABC transporter ATP-binding protein [Nonomuraea gerenzanensis]|uniref:Glycerol-3-phosphate ABC transporter, ATP-binding protein UgpC (TC 3.A.1.1.3) n=1 Tax=Nonomuraea gerenzanensis TaxID=93944 RepID=A0A1M4E1R2_9ACTN|nr:ABC transporter ATP-binding protein [Nonomuraea gerenzanensis]UBU14995.1 ABC transporter ATP-binding protein [Nonomuraea gerenzanensis]SBO92735.1 Glycerol-3-phosphate ABC transporter, ATP-binding protein UgpC (TC 3.A.1.1.3) [Nonomuraea gerenzanensis]